MSDKAIIRIAKLKTRANIAASLGHNLREHGKREVFYPHADPSLINSNIYYEPVSIYGHWTFEQDNRRRTSIDHEMRRHAEIIRLLSKRHDSVQLIEFLVTGSPEKMAQMTPDKQVKYLKKSLNWIAKRHGYENVVSAAIHRDEATPHLHVHVVPIAKKQLKSGTKVRTLSHAQWYGSRKKLSDLQTEFAAEVAAEFGLERGVHRSKARHQDLKKWRAIQEQEAEKTQEKIAGLEGIKTDKTARSIIINALNVYRKAINNQRKTHPSAEIESEHKKAEETVKLLKPQFDAIAEREAQRKQESKQKKRDRGMEW